MRTWWFVSSALHHSGWKWKWKSGGNNEDKFNDDDDDDDVDLKSVRWNQDEDNDDQTTEVEFKAYFYVVTAMEDDATTSSFWVDAFRKAKGMYESKSFTDPKVSWFVGEKCVVKTMDLDDRLTIDCDQYTLKGFRQSRPARNRMVSNKVTKLIKSHGSRNCPKSKDFLLRSLQDMDVQLPGNIAGDDFVLVRDAMHTSNILIARARDVRKALKLSNRLVVEELTKDPLLFMEKKFSIRSWVLPLRDRHPLLAYFSIGAVFASSKTYDPTDDAPTVHIPSVLPENCLTDLVHHLGEIPPMKTLIAQLKRISLLVLTAMADSVVHQNADDTSSSVFASAFCLDFEFDRSSRLWLVDWKLSNECGAEVKPKKKCKSFMNSGDYVELVNKYMVKQPPFVAKKRYKSLELLVDEAAFSEADDDICHSESSEFDSFVQNRLALREKVTRTIFREDGSPKTSHVKQANTIGLKCSKCGYLNHQESSHCDVCGSVLRSLDERSSSGRLTDDDDSSSLFSKPKNTIDFRARFISLFEKNDPARLATIDLLLERYRGEEDKLLMRLARQYEALAKRGQD